MITELARMSVIIKSQHATSVLTGNYELGYCCGLISQLSKRVIPQWQDAIQLHELALETFAGYEPADDREKNVLHMLKYYHPDNTCDDQVRELFEWGLSEKHPWQMIVR